MSLFSNAPSVQRYHELLTPLVGSVTASQWIEKWLAREQQRVDNPDFAARFEGHFSRFDAPPEAYAHRVVPVGTGNVLGGIRFFGGDYRRPFVEIVAWDHRMLPELDHLKKTVAERWRVFRPESLRLTLRPDEVPASARLDHMTYIAQVQDMAQPDDNRFVRLEPAQDPAEAHRMVKARYEAIADSCPELAADISAADLEELEECQKNGTLDYIVADGTRVGVIATWPGHDVFFRGQVIVEEVVSAEHNGHGFAQAGQSLLARCFSQTQPELLLMGTIDGKNHASRLTAERCGRSAVLHKVFVDL